MDNASGFPLLSLIIFTPLVGVVLILSLNKKWEDLIRWTALVFASIPLVLCVYAFSLFDIGAAGMQFEEFAKWVPGFGINYRLGVDGISFPLVFLSALLSVICVVISWNIKLRIKEFFALLLFMEVGMLGVFCVLDYVLFYVFWDIVLVPMYFLIGIWGGKEREYASMKFFIYTFFGGVFMIPAFLAVYFAGGATTFDILELAKQGREYGMVLQLLAFAGFYLAFAVKVPIFPFHTWLPDAHVQAPTAGSVLLAGILLKMGGYGFIRIAVPTLPDAFERYIPFLAVVGVISIVYGSLVAMAQRDLKKLIAYSSIGHMGFAVLGIAANTPLGTKGAMFVMVAHGLITGMMFILVGLIYERTGTYEIAKLRGLSGQVPKLAGIFSFAAFASLGLPGLPGFWGEFWVLSGTLSSEAIYGLAYVILALVGLIVTASYFIWTIQRVNLGPLMDEHRNLSDANPREMSALVTLVVCIVGLGIYPALLMDLLNTTVNRLFA